MTITEKQTQGLAKWKAERGLGMSAYDVRKCYGLLKADLRALEAAGLVTSTGHMDEWETHGPFGRGNLKRHQRFVVIYQPV